MKLLDGAVPWLPGPDADLAGAYDADDWDWGLGAAERVVRLLARNLRDRYGEAGPSRADDLAGISLALNRIEAVRDAVRQAIIADAATAPAGDADLVHWTAERFDRLHVTAALGWCVRAAADAYDRSLPTPDGPAGVLAAGLAVEVATQAFTAYQPFQRTAPFEFLRLGPDVETPLVDRASTDAAGGPRRRRRQALRHAAAALRGVRAAGLATLGLVRRPARRADPPRPRPRRGAGRGRLDRRDPAGDGHRGARHRRGDLAAAPGRAADHHRRRAADHAALRPGRRPPRRLRASTRRCGRCRSRWPWAGAARSSTPCSPGSRGPASVHCGPGSPARSPGSCGAARSAASAGREARRARR